MKLSRDYFFVLLCFAFLFIGCNSASTPTFSESSPKDSLSVNAPLTPIVTPEPTVTPSPTPEPTATPTPTPEPTATPTPTPEPTATPTPTPVPTATPVPSSAEGKVIYLTFDDGPSYYTEDIITLLEKYNIKATFFMCNTGRPKLIKRVHETGHAIGVHTKSHVYKEIYKSEEAYFEDLYAMQDMIYEQTGERSTLLRFPGGSSNEVSSFNPGIMTRLSKLVEEKGFVYFDWNVSSGDTSTKDTEEILNNLIKETKRLDYAIVLLHSEARDFSYNALEPYILWGLDNGYTFLPLTADSPRALHRIHN